MTYNITRTNGFNLVDLDENVIDTTTISGIGLIGKLTPNYGETQSNNFVHLVENFSNEEFPENPITGQLCYRSDVKSLYLCVNEQSIDKWRKILLIIEQNTQPTATDGILWFNTDTNVLNTEIIKYPINHGKNWIFRVPISIKWLQNIIEK